MKKLIKIKLILFLLITPLSTLNAQDSIKRNNRTTYTSLRHYKKMHNAEVTQQDSLEFKYINNDTLVLLKDYKAPKGVSVPYEKCDSIFLNLYKDIVFKKNNLKRSNKKKATIKYWKDDIHIYFDKSVSSSFKNEVLSIAENLTKNIDSLNIYETKKKEKSNYYVYAINKNHKVKHDEKINNTDGANYYISWDGRQRFYKCTFEINSLIVFNDESMIREIKKDFIKSLGLFNYSKDLNCESVFSNCYNNSKPFITKLDLEIIKYHYSYGICKGTDLETFEKQHERAKKELKSGHTTFFFHPDE